MVAHNIHEAVVLGGTRGGSLSPDISISFKGTEMIETEELVARPPALDNTAQCHNGHTDPMEGLEAEAIHMFIAVARFLGYPRSVGEIFGVLFVAEKPLSFQGISDKGGISAGSLSVGLRHLRNLGVVVVAPVAGDRRDYFAVNDDFGRVNTALIRHHVEPRISAVRGRIDWIRLMADKLTQRGRHGDLAARLRRFADWQCQLLRLVEPLLKMPQ